MIAYWISVLLFAIFCFILIGIFYLITKMQEKKLKRYVNEKTVEIINMINHNTQNLIGIALEVADLELRGKHNKHKGG